jgi:hypothetical protein
MGLLIIHALQRAEIYLLRGNINYVIEAFLQLDLITRAIN